MRILVIGGSGFIGARVARALAERGHATTTLQRGRVGLDRTPVRAVRGDRNHRADLARAVAACRPAVVLDMIPYTEEQARLLVDVVGTRAAGMVAVSSGDVYRNYDGFRGAGSEPPDPTPLGEGAPLRETRHPYRGMGLPQPWAHDYDKILVEEAFRGGPLPATILRLPAVFGPGDPQHRVGEYLARMDEGAGAIRLSREKAAWRWTRGYVKGVARAVARAAERAGAPVGAERSSAEGARTGGVTWNVGPAHTLTEAEWVRAVGEASGWEGEVTEIPAEALDEHEREPFDFSYHLSLDTGRMRRALGGPGATELQEALRETVAWERAVR